MPTRSALIGRPPTVPDVDPMRPNPNSRETPIGRVCWARWQVATAYTHAYINAEGGFSSLGVLPANTTELLQQAVDESLPLLEFEDGELPDGAMPFTRHFEQQLGQLPADVEPVRDADLLLERLDFEAYPGTDGYLAAATSSASCPEP